MTTILDTILVSTRARVAASKERVSVAGLEGLPFFSRSCHSLSSALRRAGSSGIIAECKRRSPSKGVIAAVGSITPIAQGYERAGAAAVSILTEPEFFGGSAEDIISSRPQLAIPILRKDFIVDSYQIYEAKAWGADVILLIAACLTGDELRCFTADAHRLGMEVLGEAHTEDEVRSLIGAGVDCIGINNRDLRSFTVSVQHSIDLRSRIPDSIPAVSESGIDAAATVHQLRGVGFSGFLIGECFMRTENPGEACRHFLEEVRCLS